MPKLTEGHIEQIRSMRKDGKTYQEIRDFFKETYKIKLYDSYIAAIAKGSNTTKQPGEKSGRKRAHKLILPLAEIESIPKEEPEGEEFVQHIKAAYDIYKKGFFRKVAEAIS